MCSRRLTEAVLHGCIPVFIGPPWHSQPFVQELDYSLFSLFFHVKNFQQWVDMEMESWVLDLWALDQDVRNATIHVTDLTEIEGILRSLPKRIVVTKQMALAVARPAFLWKKRFDAKRPSVTTTAIDFIYRRLCPQQEHWKPIPADDFWVDDAIAIGEAHEVIIEPGRSVPHGSLPQIDQLQAMQTAVRNPVNLHTGQVQD